jgi:Txe/YoeB family toxin of toxin-antitoxin system
MIYKIVLEKQALKDTKKIEQSKLKNKVADLLKIIKNNPFQNPPPYEKMSGYYNQYSRRINIKHRLVYEIYDDIIKIISMWTHYE